MLAALRHLMKSLLWVLTIGVFLIVPSAVGAVGFQYRSFPDGGGRMIELGIWYPSRATVASTTLGNVVQSVAVDGEIAGEHLPIVVFSHGSAGWFGDRSDTAHTLAEAGFVAVAITHPGDNYKDSGDNVVQILLNRPRHISDTLDYLTKFWPERAHLDKARIGFYGFSAGGFTGLVVVGGTPDWTLFPVHCAKNPSEGVCRQGSAAALSRPEFGARPASDWRHDSRIKAAVLAAPGWAFAFDPISLSKLDIPIALWGGSEDRVIPFESNVGYLQHHLPSGTEAHNIKHAGHYSFLRPCSEAARARNPDICTDRPGFDRAVFQAHLNRELVRFFLAALAVSR